MNAGCLGIPTLDCAYDPTTAEPVFSIGELLAVLGLILAFRALAQPQIRFRLQVAGFSERAAFGVLVFACIATLAGVLLRVNDGWRWPLVGYPIFWELLAAVLMLGLALHVLAVSSRTAKFSTRNARRYMERTFTAIARADSDVLGVLADELRESINPVIDTCSEYDPLKAWQAEQGGEKYVVPERVRVATTVLDSWSDPRLCRAMVVRAPGTAIALLQKLSAVHRDFGKAVVDEIVDQALSNIDSMLYREEEFSPLGRGMLLARAIAGNYQFIRTYRPLQAWNWRNRRSASARQLEKYGQLTLMMVDQYIEARAFYDYPAEISSVLDSLIGDLRSIVWTLNDTEDLGAAINDDSVYWKLDAIGSVLEETIKRVVKAEAGFPEYPPPTNGQSKFDDHSIFGVLAHAVYSFIEVLAQATRHEDLIRSALLEVWFEVFPVSGAKDNSRARAEIRGRLIPEIRAKVQDNLDLEHRYYPAVTRLLLNLWGPHNPEDAADDSSERDLRRWFVDLLAERYTHVVAVDPDMAAALLPEKVSYDAERRVLRMVRHRRATPVELQLKPAPSLS